MDTQLNEKLEAAIWAAKSLFERGRTSGSSANLSFLHDGKLYITASGSCFGRLTREDFSALAPDGRLLEGRKPSKELPLHQSFYGKDPAIQAVIHTHGPFATLWSCRHTEPGDEVLPEYTPYFKMKVGKAALVPYEKPGSPELFAAFRRCLDQGDAFFLKNHGAIVGGKSVMDAFYAMEELEESARIAVMIQRPERWDRIGTGNRL